MQQDALTGTAFDLAPDATKHGIFLSPPIFEMCVPNQAPSRNPFGSQTDRETHVFAEIGNGEVLLWIFWLFMFVIWFWVLITIFGDIFRSHDLSGAMKAFWTIFVIILPWLGILLYLCIRGSGMQDRALAQAKDQQAKFTEFVQSSAAASDPVEAISKAKALLDSGAINQTEFDALKAKALS